MKMKEDDERERTTNKKLGTVQFVCHFPPSANWKKTAVQFIQSDLFPLRHVGSKNGLAATIPDPVIISKQMKPCAKKNEPRGHNLSFLRKKK